MINCDTDPIIGPNQKSDFRSECVWEKTIKSITNLKENMSYMEDKFNINPKITWHLRSDQQINEIWGDWCYPAQEYLNIWADFRSLGDEIGWHPHLWRLNKANGIWFQEARDTEWISYCLRNAYDRISRIINIKSVRMGWSFHSTYTMNIINSLGIKYDLSAIPGIKSMGSNSNDNIYDWVDSEREQYRPSYHNYKCSDCKSKHNLSVVEIPITTYALPYFLQVLTGKKFMTANIAKSPLFFKNAIKYVTHRWDGDDKLMNTFFHPSDLKSNNKLFSIDNVLHNLEGICNIKGCDIVFITPHEYGSLLMEDYY